MTSTHQGPAAACRGYRTPAGRRLTLSSEHRGRWVREVVRVYAGRDGTLRPWLPEPHLRHLARSCSARGIRHDVAGEARSTLAALISRQDAAADARVDLVVTPDGTLTAGITTCSRTWWLATGAGLDLTTSADRIGSDPALTVVAFHQGRAVVAPPADPANPPVMHEWVSNAVRELGFGLSFARPAPALLRAADEILVCGTELEFAPVGSVDGVAPAGWPDCPASTAVVDRFFDQARA